MILDLNEMPSLRSHGGIRTVCWLLSGLSFVSVWQEEWKSCPGALQDGHFTLGLHGGRLRHEEAALAAGFGPELCD